MSADSFLRSHAIEQEIRSVLEPAVRSEVEATRLAFEQLKARGASMKGLAWASRAVQSVDQKAKYPVPAYVGSSEHRVCLSDCVWSSATVGFGQALRNRAYGGDIEDFFLESAQGLHRKGLYAHAESNYEFDLGGNWERLEGSIALQTRWEPIQKAVIHPYNHASVEFVILADGREIYSARINGDRNRVESFKVKIRGVHQLSLQTRAANGSISGDHGIWIKPVLVRPRSLEAMR